jgi:hypothetical protein
MHMGYSRILGCTNHVGLVEPQRKNSLGGRFRLSSACDLTKLKIRRRDITDALVRGLYL